MELDDIVRRPFAGNSDEELMQGHLDPLPSGVDHALVLFLAPPDTSEFECRGRPLGSSGGMMDPSGFLRLAPEREMPSEFRLAVAVWSQPPDRKSVV